MRRSCQRAQRCVLVQQCAALALISERAEANDCQGSLLGMHAGISRCTALTHTTCAGAAAVGAAKKRLVAGLLKKFVAEELLPVLLELRGVLNRAQGERVGAISDALFALLREHKSEVREQIKHS